MRIALTGATGFIGSALVKHLRNQGHETIALSRQPKPETIEGAGAVVHLAGEPVAQRWSSEAKRRIRESRVYGTRRLVEALQTLTEGPRALVCASAIGYYGDRRDGNLTEVSNPGQGFLPDTCVEWEREAKAAESLGIRVVRLRIGIVLGRGGGALKQMLPPFRMGVGGRLGDGKQWMSWIYLQDLVRMFEWAIMRDDLSGAVNATAPGAVTNAQFTRALSAVLRRPAIIPVPEFALRLLFGEMARLLLESQRVTPQVAESKGFQFKYPELGPALRELLDS